MTSAASNRAINKIGDAMMTETFVLLIFLAVLAGAGILKIEFWVPAFLVCWLESGVNDLPDMERFYE